MSVTIDELTRMQQQIMRSTSSKHFVLVDLLYPYRKPKIYMGASLCVVAAQLEAMGHTVEILDLNLDDLESPSVVELLHDIADFVGVSVVGSPYLPSAIAFAQKMAETTRTPVLVGGQVVSKLSPEQFRRLFAGTNAIQIANNNDLAAALGCEVSAIPGFTQIPYVSAWEGMGDDRLRTYLEHEFALVVSQGCHHACEFCAAAKAQRERHIDVDAFRMNLQYLAYTAKRFGLSTLECYTTSLDFFQNPSKVLEHLITLIEVQEQTRIRFRVRCLSCMDSFLQAAEQIPDFDDLLRRAGLWCVGFGVDGTDDEVWEAQRKQFNKLADVTRCLELCERIGLRGEVLMVLGFPQDTPRTLGKNFRNAVRFARTWQHVVLRPYLAKPFVPGNRGWSKQEEQVEAVLQDPDLFYNLDFCALGSRLTHPGFLHRWASNLAYLGIIALLTPFGKCVTSPLLPQGSGPVRWLAKGINYLMPFDR